jgi:hypothetical protein
MSQFLIMSLIDESIDAMPIGGLTASAVLADIRRIVGAYATAQPDPPLTTAWMRGLNHVPFLLPAGQTQDTNPIGSLASLDLSSVLSQLTLSTIRPYALPAERSASLVKLSGSIGDALSASLTREGAAELGVILMLATQPSHAAPNLSITIVRQTYTKNPSARPAGEQHRVASSYRFGFDRLSDEMDLQAWKKFAAIRPPNSASSTAFSSPLVKR